MAELTTPLLADRVEICELTAAYNRTFDQGDGDGWLATFTHGGELVVGGQASYTGQQLVDFCVERRGQFHHVTANPEISVEGDTAVQRCSLMLLSVADDCLELVAAGRYVDELRRTAAGWRFQRRAVTLTRTPQRSPR